jgi:hypothetical protein
MDQLTSDLLYEAIITHYLDDGPKPVQLYAKAYATLMKAPQTLARNKVLSPFSLKEFPKKWAQRFESPDFWVDQTKHILSLRKWEKSIGLDPSTKPIPKTPPKAPLKRAPAAPAKPTPAGPSAEIVAINKLLKQRGPKEQCGLHPS